MQEYIKKFKIAEEVILKSSIIENVKESFLTAMSNEELPSADKSIALAQFFSNIADKQLTLILQMIKDEQELVLKDKQMLLNEKLTSVDAALKTEQINSSKEMLLIQKNKADIEISLQKEQLQISYLQQILLELQAYAEHFKIHTIDKSAKDNLNIKQGELLISFLQLAVSKDWLNVQSESIFTYMLNQINKIVDKSEFIALICKKTVRVNTPFTIRAIANVNYSIYHNDVLISENTEITNMIFKAVGIHTVSIKSATLEKKYQIEVVN